ncbi:uncharacterized protein LOC127738985 [Mytilus californianus]|uniref:uncharacterized protein LOC127738985 n=1 Tax=Mytilus californianus TaxID=6549 RepID=UPI0022463032|nr:uncharacterized protein LOC127738985 [Mytilus californianus]
MTQKQRENFYRTSTIIVEHGKEVLLLLLEDDLSKRNLTLIDFININQHAIYHLCYNKHSCCQCTGGAFARNTTSQRVLYPCQLDILFDKTGPTMTGHNLNSRSQFCCSAAKQSLTTSCLDLTLLRCLLINFAPSCTGAVRKDVDDLIKYRNILYGHSQEAKMCDTDYSGYKIQIESVILSIAKQCNKEQMIRQKLNDATVRPLDETISTQYQITLLDEMRREKKTKETIVNMHDALEQQTKKINEMNRNGRNILSKLMYSMDLVCCSLIFPYVDFVAFIFMLFLFICVYFYLLEYLPSNLVIFLLSIVLLFIVIIITPDILGTVILFIESGFNFSLSVYSNLITRETVPALFLVYYIFLFKVRFKMKNFSVSLNFMIIVIPFCFCSLHYLWPYILSFIFNNFKMVIAILSLIIGLKCCIW